MSMDQRQFEALVQRMERFAVRAPGAYRSWVLALAVFGYTLVLALVIVLLLLLALLAFGLRHAAWLSVKLGLVVGALLLVVLRSLWVRLEPPTGEPLARQEAPAFFARLDRLVARLHTPRVHRVLVTEDFNAAVMQLPRLGIFGWYRNYLLIGLPLMQCLSRPQFEAVLAHELGRSEEHTSELQSLTNLVCRLLLEKKKTNKTNNKNKNKRAEIPSVSQT